MANTKKETKTTSTPVVEKESILEKENLELKKQFAEMQEQFAMMQEMIKNMTGFTKPVVTTSIPRDIEVISLTPGQLVLTTTGKSDGRHYEFPDQFATRSIPEDDLKQIVKSMIATTDGGYFFINDVEFIAQNSLNSAYRVMLDKAKLSNYFNLSYQEAITLYDNAPNAQKKIIESMITDKKLKGEFVDANILMEIGKRANKDFMNIEPLLTKED